MSDEKAGGFVAYLIERFQGEVYGEAVFAAMANADPNPDSRYKWRVLEALERETKEYLARALRERGHSAEESNENRLQGDKLGRRLVAVPRALFMTGFRAEVLRFVAEYEQAEAFAPADGLAVARHVTAHERAILEFADHELAGRGADSVAPVLALLAEPPSPPSHSAGPFAAS
jgi:hypothetical protein